MSQREMPPDYDGYWRERDRPRAEARSRERARLAVRLLEGRACGKRLIDLGCGPGWTLEVFRDAGFAAAGADVSEVALDEAARRGFAVRRVDLEREPLESLRALGDGDWDVVVLLEVLEHLADPLRVLERVRSFVREEACLVVSLPNEIHLLARLSVAAGRLPFGGHEDPHLRHFDRRGARALIRAAGFRVIGEAPVSVAPPRWGPFARLFAPAARILPGAFALSTVYLLESAAAAPKKEYGNDGRPAR